MIPERPTFLFRERDVELSFRRYLMTAPIRQLDRANGLYLPIPSLHPGMASDTEQGGIRFFDLYDEEKVPCFPCVGVLCKELVNTEEGSGFSIYQYSFFIDAICKVNDGGGGVDRIATYNQRSDLFSDLRYLIVDRPGRGIPFYVFNDDGTTTEVGTFSVVKTNPKPRISNSPSKQKGALALHADFMIEVILQDVKPRYQP